MSLGLAQLASSKSYNDLGSTASVAHMGSFAGLLTGGATAGAEWTQGIGFGGAPPATVGWPFTEVIAAPVTSVRPAYRDSNVLSEKTLRYHGVWHTGRQVFLCTARWPLSKEDLLVP